jgi:hypothetical protein
VGISTGFLTFMTLLAGRRRQEVVRQIESVGTHIDMNEPQGLADLETDDPVFNIKAAARLCDTSHAESYFYEVMRSPAGQAVNAGLKPEDRVSPGTATGVGLVVDVDSLEAADDALLAAAGLSEGSGPAPAPPTSGGRPKRRRGRGLDPEERIQTMIDVCAERDQPIIRTPNTKYVNRQTTAEFECGRCHNLCYPRYATVVGMGCGPCWPCGAAVGGRKLSLDSEEAIQEVIDVCARRGHPIARTPNTEYAGNQTPIEFLCLRCNEPCSPTRNNIIDGKQGPCNPCADAANGLEQRLDPAPAVQAMIDACTKRGQPIIRTPNTKYVRCHDPIEFECGRCHNLCYPCYANAVHTGTGPCGACGTGGLDMNAETTLYYLQHARLGLAKIGITGTNSTQDRVAGFERLGWKLRTSKVYTTGHEAKKFEKRIHDHLRARDHQVDKEIAREGCGGMNGHTEVFWLAGVLETFTQDDLFDWAA